jgi:uncharacterized protein (TIGR02145 family)
MKKIFTFLFIILGLSTFSQTLQNIHKSNGTFSNPINQIDSIRFNATTNQMEVVLQSGVQAHSLSDVVNITYTTPVIGCGSITSVTDIEGNEYPVVQIGLQCWTKQNLRTSTFADGSAIPNVTSDSIWANLESPAWCNFGNNVSNGNTYGKLYNWYTVADPRSICPAGWRVPTDAEWTILIDYLGGGIVAGGKMKSITGWNAPNGAATDESGFSGLPGGGRFSDAMETFSSLGLSGLWWGSNPSSIANAWYMFLYYGNGNGNKFNTIKKYGFSVRCLKD